MGAALRILREITETLDVLVHDGYLEAGDGGYRFASNLLKDWWEARFRDNYTPLATTPPAATSEGSMQ